MKAKTGITFKVFSLFFVILLFGCTLHSLAAKQDDPPAREEAAASAPPGTSPGSTTPAQAVAPASAEPPGGTSSYWHSFIWEAMPAEWLRDNSQSVIQEAYQQHGWRPFFIDSTFQLTRGAHLFLQRLEKLENDAIDPKPYQLETLHKHIQNLEKLRMALKSVDPKLRDSRADLSDVPSFDVPPGPPSPPSSSASGQNAMDTSEARPLDPGLRKEREQKYREIFRAASEIDIRLAGSLVRFAREMDPFCKDEQVKALAGEIPISQFLQQLEPTLPSYGPLHKSYNKYKHLAVQVPHVPVIGASRLRPGGNGNEVRNLQKRLQQEDFYSGSITGSFDAATQQAVKQFQAVHMLEGDGTIGPGTVKWLSISYEQKARMIAMTLKLLRQSQTRRCDIDRYVRINIPQFTLQYYRGGKVQAVHRVIVGKASGKPIKVQGRMISENNTPPLASTIEHVIFNPRWYVSDRIRRELSDEIAADPHYLERHGYVQMASLYPWGDHRVFQMPGPNNPLGRVKFEFPNAYAVFLHDTPKKQLFSRARRDFSHGCVRVDRARELAQTLLIDDQNPAAQKTEAYLDSNRQVYVKLQQPVPIIIEYMPVSYSENGHIVFCGDPYGWLDEN